MENLEKNQEVNETVETTANAVVQEMSADTGKYISPTEEEIYKEKEEEIIDKHDPKISEDELIINYPKEFLENSKKGEMIPCIVWQGVRLNGLLGHENIRIFLVREDILEKETKTGKIKKKIFLFKNYLNVFTTFQQISDGKRFTSDAEIYQHPVWVRIEECSSDKFSVWDKESHYYLNRRDTISEDLFVSICDLVHNALDKDAKTIREELIDLLSRDGRDIKIDELAIIPKSKDKEGDIKKVVDNKE